ncbi:MAG: hypothetical protein ABR548_06600 [Actinomycetota bacterium]|nr:hypothetical protein [Actinomycetota bacterium]
MTSRATWVRGGLLALAVSQGATGLWALASPHAFWSSFPGFGRHWLRPLGPYNDELVRDFGAMYVALSAALSYASLVMDSGAIRAALIGQVAFLVLHAYFVSFKLSLLPAGDAAGLMGGIVVTLVVASALLVATRHDR